MKWTLRHLLDYLDDKLDPEQTRRLGVTIAEHEGAHQIVERLRQITRKRRLSAPDLANAEEDHPGDPNLVAGYLDDRLTGEEVAELERLCADSDLYLAEVAACHQIISVGDSEPVVIPPTARQRMYGLVEGREAIRNRPVKAPVPTASHYDVDGEVADGEGDLLFEPVWQRVRRRTSVLFPIAALLLVVLLVALVFYLVGGTKEEKIAHAAPTESAPVVKDKVAQPKVGAAVPPVAKNEGEAAGKPVPAGLIAVWPLAASEFKNPNHTATWLVSTWMAQVASRPALPPNFLLGLGREELVILADKAEAPSMPAPLKPQVPTVRRTVGRNLAEIPKDGLLFRDAAANDWRVVRPAVPIFSQEKLMVLPGYRNDIEVNKLKLTLIGTVPTGQGTPYFLETAIMLHAADDQELDLTLLRGRLIILARPDTVSKVRLRHLDHVWDLKLPPVSQIALECTGRVPPGTGEWIPQRKLVLHVLNGNVNVERDGKKETVKRGMMLVWDSVYASPGPGTVSLQNEPPTWIAKPVYPDSVKKALSAFQEDILAKVKNQQKETQWIVLACEETLDKGREAQQHLALFCLGAMDQLPSLAKGLNHPVSLDIRRTAMNVLLHWAGRQPRQDEVLRKMLNERGYKEDEADILLGLLRRVDQPDRATVERLLGYLLHSRLAIRELAYMNLSVILPPDRLAGYDPAAPADKLETSVAELRKRLLVK